MDGRASTSTGKEPTIESIKDSTTGSAEEQQDSNTTTKQRTEEEINFFDGHQLKRLFAEKGRKRDTLRPTDEYRTSISRVKEWFAFSIEDQKIKKEEWKKKSHRAKRKISDAIPNQEKNKRRPINADPATRTHQDKRLKVSIGNVGNESATGAVKKRGRPAGKSTALGEKEQGTIDYPVGLSSSVAEQEKVAQNMQPKKKRKKSTVSNVGNANPQIIGAHDILAQNDRSVAEQEKVAQKIQPKKKRKKSRVSNVGNANPQIIGAHDILAQNDRSVWEQRNRVLREFSTYIAMIQPTFPVTKETPRHKAYLVISNEVMRRKRGKQKETKLPKREVIVMFNGKEKENDNIKIMKNMAKDLYDIGTNDESRNKVDLKLIVETREKRSYNGVKEFIEKESAQRCNIKNANSTHVD